MVLEFMAEIDLYIDMISPRAKNYDKLTNDEKAFFVECATKEYFARYLRDELRKRDYSDPITIEFFLINYAKKCIEMQSKYPVEEDPNALCPPRHFWSLGFDVAETFRDYIDYAYDGEVLVLK